MLSVVHERPESRVEILTVGGRSYAFGLRWNSASSRSTLRAEAMAAAVAEGANYVVLHRDYNQFGLGTITRAPTGIRGLAYRPRSGVAAIAAAAGAATLAAFPLDDDRWLVLAIDRKGFLPDGDMIVANAEQAKTRIETLISQSPNSWRRKLLPAEWGIADSRTVNPVDLLSRSSAPALTPLWLLANRFSIRVASAAVIAVSIAVVFAAVHFSGQPSTTPVVAFQPPKPVAASWTPAAVALDSCLSGLRSAQRYNRVPGWLPTKYSCIDGESVVIDFARAATGQIGMIRGLLPQARLSDDGRAAVLAVSLSSLPRVSAVGVFSPVERYRLIGLDLSQRLNGTFTIQIGRKLLPGETEAPQPNQAWRLFSWSYQTRAPAIVWAGPIARLGSISVDTLVFTPADNLWQLTGSLYASN